MFSRKAVLLFAGCIVAAGSRPGIAGDASSIPLSSPVKVNASFAGDALLTAGHATALSMVSGDFDMDGYGDLAVGYATADGGRVAIYRGNVDAFAPQSDASFWAIARAEFPSPFLPNVQIVALPGQPDFLAAGMFIGHNGPALLAGTRGGSKLYVLAPDDSGQFQLQQTIDLSGAITVLGTSKLYSGAYAQAVVGVRSDAGSALLVYTGSNDGLQAAQSFSLAADATALAFSDFDRRALPDLLVVAGGSLWTLRGGSNSLESIPITFQAMSAAFGSFVFDRNQRLQIAVLAKDGSVHILAHISFDPQPLSLTEMQARRRELVEAHLSRSPARAFSQPRTDFAPEGWQEIESINAVTQSAAPLMFRTRITPNGSDDIMLLDGGRLLVIAHPDAKPDDASFAPGVVLTQPQPYTSSIAALAERVNIDGHAGVILLPQGDLSPSVLMPLPDPTYHVDTTNDILVANACTLPIAGSCSLREAIVESNAAGGTNTIMVPAGTYTLTIPRAASPLYDAKAGALDVTTSANIIGAVDGSGNPTTIIQAGTTTANEVDEIFRFNPDILSFSNAAVSLSNLVLQNGCNRGTVTGNGDGWGGAFYSDTGGSGNNSVTITNVNIQSNRTGCPTTSGTGGEGGGFAIFNSNGGTGTVTMTNSTVQNNTAVRFNASSNGGGIMVLTPGSLTVTNTKVLNNSVPLFGTTDFGTGGGISILGGASASIHGSTISGNSGSGQGGGIYSLGALTVDQSTALTNNTAAGSGGGIWMNPVAASTLSLTKMTVTGNTAQGNPNAGSQTGLGGGIFAGSNSPAFSISFSRFASNSALNAGTNLYNDPSSPGVAVTATNNWWGTNTPSSTIFPSTPVCVATAHNVCFDPFIVLTHTPSPNKIRINLTATLTADMSKDNHGNGAALSGNLDVLNGVPVTFGNVVDGSISNAQATMQSNAMATATFTAGGVAGGGKADATVDNQTVTANITVLAPPSITKSFNPVSVPKNGVSTITIGITNPNVVTIDSSFTDTLPAGLVVASTPNVTNTCGGSVTAAAGSGSISFANAALAVGSCTITVDETSAVDNTYTNSVTLNSSDAGNSNTATATLTVINPPHIAKAFGAATIPLNGTTTLILTIDSNGNQNLTLTGVAFTDSLPAGLVNATPSNVSTTCSGGTATAANGGSSVSLSGASVAPSSSCTVTVTVQGATGGLKNNSVQVTSTNGGTGNTASASINVVAPPAISKAFSAASIPLNGTATVTFTITNPNATAAGDLSGVSFSDTLPSATGTLVVAAVPNVSNTCGGTVTATAGAGSISLSGASVAHGASCTLSVDVKGTAAGDAANTTGAITSNESGAGATSNTATIKIVAPPTIQKAFGAASILVNGTTTVTFTITNPAANTTAENGVAFSDTLTGGLQVASTPGVANTCGGTVTAAANTTTIALSGGTIATPGSTCTLTVNVTGTLSGNISNTTGAVSSTNGGTGAASNTATLIVANPPSITKAFSPNQIPLNGTSSLSFTITNPNSNVSLTGIGFTAADTLPAGLVVATPGNVTNTCGGTATAADGSGSVNLTGGTLAGGGTCTLTVNVKGTTAGSKSNSVQVTAAETGAGNTSTAGITVVAPPSISKAFGAASIQLGGTTSLTFTITNPAANTVAESGVAFSDTLPSGLVVATPNGLSSTCGGTATAVAGSSSISLSGGVIATNSSCTVAVTVMGTAGGVKNNTSGAVSSTNGGTGNTASASITVNSPQVTPTSATVFLGLKNSDDQGTNFDVQVQLLKNGTPISSGLLRCVTGVTRNPAAALQVTVPFGSVTNGSLASGDVLSFTVLTRIGTNPDDTKCAGHSSAVGLRLYYDATSRASDFNATITPNPAANFFLHTTGASDFFNTTAPTGATALTKDSGGVNFSGGNPFQTVGTWSVTQP